MDPILNVDQLGMFHLSSPPQAKSYDEVPVTISVNGAVYKDFVSAFCSAIDTKLSLIGGSNPVSQADIASYLEYAVFARVSYVNRQHRSEWHTQSQYRIPSFLGVFLAQVGICENAGIGIRLVPVWKDKNGKSTPPKADPALLSRVSTFFAWLENHGFEMMAGLPRGTSGSWALMSMELVEGYVCNYTAEHHPTYAVMAAFFGATGLANVLGAQCYRVRYVSENQVMGLSYDLINWKKA